ncbi:hypothetical protein BDZ85DRAFT_267581 [Elsinoe ampelina]|uniref:Tim44-like domain-containing protein n=1 Tax=Elsinoe ampelina TaxID=302913 RepID=A0A6A6G3T7_9PEZI|nr:hypothetical protein BDZ85DRAFT_267581 [Elsinoe ampelina]
MASKSANRILHLPLRPSNPFSFTHTTRPTPALSRRNPAPSIRSISISSPRHASARPSSVARTLSKTGANKPLASPAIMQKEALRKAISSGSAFDFIGLAPETFVTLPSSQRPSWINQFSDRWLWEKTRLMSRGRTALIILYYKFWALRTRSPRQVEKLGTSARLRYRIFEWWDFEILKTRKVVKRLYEEMYNRLADGEVERLEGRVKRDLMASLKGRVMARGQNDRIQWRLERYTKTPRCVGYSVLAPDVSAASKPAWTPTLLQQAVLEVESMQSVKKEKRVTDGKGGWVIKDVSEGPKGQDGWPLPKKVKEYVVLHKHVRDGKSSRWMIWGMTKPTTLYDVKKQLREKLGQAEV